MVIDSHIHLFPPEMALGPAEWAVQNAEPHWSKLMVAEEGKPSLQDWPDLQRVIQAMDEAGVEQAILQGWYWENPQSCELHNRFYLKCMEAFPQRLRATLSWHKDVAQDPVAWLADWLDRGFVGVGELLPAVQGMTWQDDLWQPVCELLTERGLPLMFHVTEPVGRRYPGKVATPFEDIQQFLECHPQQKVVLAHWGGLLPMYHLHRPFAKLLDNVYVDTAASPLLYQPEVFKIFPQAFPAERILFGSDYPLRLYGRKQPQAEMRKFVEEAVTQLAEQDRDAVMRANAIKVYGLDRINKGCS